MKKINLLSKLLQEFILGIESCGFVDHDFRFFLNFEWSWFDKLRRWRIYTIKNAIQF